MAEEETMAMHDAEIDQQTRKLHEGELVTGVVAGVSDSEVTVDLGTYASGIIRALDYSADPGFSLKNDVHVGDEVSAVVLRAEDGNGNILLSRREAVEQQAWDRFQKMMEDGTVTDVKVADAVKGGVVAYLDGIRAFIPASHLALSYVEDLNTFKGKTVPVRIITVDPEKKRLVLSSREVLRERREAEKAERISNIHPGLVTEGTVQSLQPYGAFVSLGDGVDGLVHISQISSAKRLNHPKEALEVGQKVKVKVTGVKDGKISLSMKALDEAAAEPVEEERVELPKEEALTTSLGSLLKNIHL